MSKYSILIPVHNEVNHIPLLLNSLKYYSNEGHEVIIIDDGSDDGGTKILKNCKMINLICIPENKGKGYALKEGLKSANNEKVVIFDGDMELDPKGIEKLMVLNKSEGKRFVMGYRFKYLCPLKSSFDWGNFMFTSFFNIIFNTNYKDILCCAKSFYINDLKDYEIISTGFDIDVEIASLFSIIEKKKRFIIQVPLNYNRRNLQEGKKLEVSDGWFVLLRIIKMVQYA